VPADLVLAHQDADAELAEREGVDDRYVGCVPPLAFLAPEIVEAIAHLSQCIPMQRSWSGVSAWPSTAQFRRR